MDEIKYLGANTSKSFDIGDGLVLDITYYEFDGQISAVIWDKTSNTKRVVVDIYTDIEDDTEINCEIVDFYNQIIEDIDYFKDQYYKEVER